MKYVYGLLALALSFCITLATPAHAQRRGGGGGNAQGTITGKVVDSSSGEALGNATIAIRSAADSSLVTGAIAEHDGSFTITGLRPGRYHARISYVGFLTHVVRDVEITAGGPPVSLGTIAMVTDASISEGVTVNGKREFMTLALDRTIYKTSDLKVAAGGNASDVLRNIPSIDVDPDGNVSLRGSANVAIQINGRPTMMTGASLAAFLRSLPSDAVERVEVIPNPSAKYDPDGMSGIINIVLKQNSDRGFSGGFNGAVGSDPDADIAGNIGYGSGPWNLYANYAFHYEVMRATSNRLRRSLIAGPPARLDQTAYDTTYTSAHTLNLSADYAMAEGHSLSLTAFLNERFTPNYWVTHASESDASGELTGRNDRFTISDDAGLTGDARLGYKWVIEPTKHELSTEVRFGYSNYQGPRDYHTDFFTADGTVLPEHNVYRTNEDDHYRTYTAQADYSRSLGEHDRMEAGYKGELNRISNDFRAEILDTVGNTYVLDALRTNTFTYDRSVHAGYLTYSHDFGEVEAEVGLRAEQAATTFALKTTGQTYDNDYTSLFPSAFISYKPFEGLQLKTSYSRRINRPDLWQLNPFPNFDDPTFRSIGNPNLKPEYIDSYDFVAAYFFDNGSIMINPYFRRITDHLSRWEAVDSLGTSILTYENFNSAKNYGADVVASVRVGEWLNGFVAASMFQDDIDVSNVETDLYHSTLIWALRGNATFTIVDGLDLQVTYFYRGPLKIVGGTIEGSGGGDASLVWKIFEKRGTLGLNVTDPLKTMGFQYQRTFAGFYNELERSWNSRTLSLTFSYTFGDPGRRNRQRSDAPPPPQSSGFGM